MSYAQHNQKSLVLPSDAYDSHPIKKVNDLNLAINDTIQGFKNFNFWSFMALSDIRRRYKRTVIGPFWTTLSLAIFIFCAGFILSAMWSSNSAEFLPYFCSGYI